MEYITTSQIDRDGYRLLTLRDSETKKYRRTREHTWKAEKVLGLNGDKLDCTNSNLLICSSVYHGWLHAEMGRRYMQEKFGANVQSHPPSVNEERTSFSPSFAPFSSNKK